jgi:hypothetical protein
MTPEALAKAVEEMCITERGWIWESLARETKTNIRREKQEQLLAALGAIEADGWKMTNRKPTVEQQTAGLNVRGVGNLALPYALWETMHDTAPNIGDKT